MRTTFVKCINSYKIPKHFTMNRLINLFVWAILMCGANGSPDGKPEVYSDPVAFIRQHWKLAVGDIVFRIEVAFDGLDKPLILLNTKADLEQDFKENVENLDDVGRSFWISLNCNPDGTYSKPWICRQPAGDLIDSFIEISKDACYFGVIEELGKKKGIVTIKVDRAGDQEPVATIYGYTWSKEHGWLTQTKLAEYKYWSKNEIFDKYLSKDKRTFLKPQEIKL